MDTLNELVGAGGDACTIRERRKEQRKCSESLAKLGIIVADGRIRRDESDDI